MFDGVTECLERIISVLWGPATVILFLAVGAYFSIRLGVPQLLRIKLWLISPLKTLFGKRKSNKGVLCTVLAATAGTGNIVGVAAALMAGGAGSVFWMWVSAFFGMALGFSENVLGFYYRKHQKGGGFSGSAAFYIEKGLKSKPLAILFNIACALAAFGIGNLTQGNSLVGGISAVANDIGVPFGSKNALLAGIAVAALAAPVILGGKDRIAKTAERIVPAAVVAFLAVSVIIVGLNYKRIIPSITAILYDAFDFKSAMGGAVGFCISKAMRVGLSRGLFSHEAGMGTSVFIHASAKSDSPTETGFFSMFEVFVDTVVVCTLTALVILTSGVYDNKTPITNAAQLVSAAFSSVLGDAGSIFVAILLFVFAFATILGWGCFGQTALSCVTKRVLPYKIVYIAAIPLGCVLQMQFCWYLSDILNWVMAILNVFAITVLSKKVFEISKDNLGKGIRIKNGTKKGSGNT